MYHCVIKFPEQWYGCRIYLITLKRADSRGSLSIALVSLSDVRLLGKVRIFVSCKNIRYPTKCVMIQMVPGPMKKQMGDFGVFWAMVWQQKVEKIVMVTKLKEKGVRARVL